MSLTNLPNFDALSDYLSYTSLLELGFVIAFLLCVASVLLVRLFRDNAKLRRQYDSVTLRYQRAEEQLSTVWNKEL
jgi:positive regulator of sigma E activity